MSDKISTYEPEENELYYFISGGFEVHLTAWHGDCVEDFMNLQFGNIFKTEQEAKAAIPALYNRLTGEFWEDCNDKV